MIAGLEHSVTFCGFPPFFGLLLVDLTDLCFCWMAEHHGGAFIWMYHVWAYYSALVHCITAGQNFAGPKSTKWNLMTFFLKKKEPWNLMTDDGTFRTSRPT